jgi:hypothetical protein
MIYKKNLFSFPIVPQAAPREAEQRGGCFGDAETSILVLNQKDLRDPKSSGDSVWSPKVCCISNTVLRGSHDHLLILTIDPISMF